MKNYLLSVLVVIVLCIPVINPLLSSGYFPMHDDTQVARVVTMGRALRNGQFPVRWVSDLGYGYGYPIFNFYGPLPYYVGGVLYSLGLSGLDATKIMMMVGMLLAGVSMFVVITKIFGNLAAITASILYLYAPYHAVQLYVRGAIGELWTLVFIPFVVASIYQTFVGKKYQWAILSGTIGIAGTILSHTLLGFTTVFFFCVAILLLGLITLIKKVSFQPILVVAISCFSGLALSCFFWLPAIMEMRYTAVSQQIGPTAQVADHFVCLSQFIYSPWGFGGSTPGCTDGLSFALGKIHMLFIIMGIVGFIMNRNQKKFLYLSIISLLLVVTSLFFMTGYSAFLWKVIPGFSYIQYPWRFLVYTVTGTAIFAAVAIGTVSKNSLRLGITIFSIIGVVLMNAKLFTPQYLYERQASEFETEQDIKFRASRISDEYLPPDIERPHDVSKIVTQLVPSEDTFTYKNIIDKESYKKIEFIAKKETTIILNQAYFPGWKFWINSTMQPIILDKGRPVITIPNEFSTLEMWFTDTPARLVGNIISLMSMVLLIYYYGKKTVS